MATLYSVLSANVDFNSSVPPDEQPVWSVVQQVTEIYENSVTSYSSSIASGLKASEARKLVDNLSSKGQEKTGQKH